MRSFFILRCFLLFFFLFDLAFAAEGKIWSRTDMVEMAGYGEQKLSSVIITGSLLCDTSHSISIPGMGKKVADIGKDRGSIDRFTESDQDPSVHIHRHITVCSMMF
ncbi:unnamed protein product [Brassica rapa subsp. narinosa]